MSKVGIKKISSKEERNNFEMYCCNAEYKQNKCLSRIHTNMTGTATSQVQGGDKIVKFRDKIR